MSPAKASVPVSLGSRAYDVHVGEGLLAGAGAELAGLAAPGPALVVTDSNVGPLYLDELMSSLAGAGFAPEAVTVPAGEGSKSLGTVRLLYGALLDLGADRGTPVVALGGGMVSDLAGFAAASFLRGLPWVALPTTLLAMVDASVGGKTGVNLDEGKNLVGAFHQPGAVLADLATLGTLPERELRSGLAELVKAGLGLDAGLLEALEAGDGASVSTVAAAIRVKAEIVAADERESDRRRLLNLGHTAGHAIEAAAGYGPVLHGEAVAVGLVCATRISVRRSIAKEGLVARVSGLLGALGLPTTLDDLPVRPDRERVREHLVRDKKRRGGALALVLPAEPGRAVIVEDGTEAELLDDLFGV
ncbi:MAG: 3-dehydroquinate synthase [Planctomycetota bacterium]